MKLSIDTTNSTQTFAKDSPEHLSTNQFGGNIPYRIFQHHFYLILKNFGIQPIDPFSLADLSSG